jgi:mRNA deadenylase 3'-5' endonuclease subunit Ccr4
MVVRMETEVDPCLDGIHTLRQVWQHIVNVREEQAQYGYGHGCADLYPRTWNRVPHSRTGDMGVTSTAPSPRVSFNISVAQFNTLAEGLSAGPDVSPPFRDESGAPGEASRAADKGEVQPDKSVYGGFTHLPHPKISLDFSLRRWRLLEVLLGSPSSTSDAVHEGEDDDTSETLLSQLPFDLIAMEEVDRYHGFFAPILRLLDYQGIFCPKPSSPGVKMGWYSDGCCMFWKKSVFTLVSEHRGQYPESNQVYLLAALRHKQTAQDIVVAVTHLKAQQNQANELVRCRQADALREQIDQMIASVQNNNSQRKNDPSSSLPDIPVLILGDFNADPPSKGAVDASSSTEDSAIGRMLLHHTRDPSNMSISHNYRSSYPIDDLSTFYTTWKARGTSTVRRVIDYIFYTSETLECTATLKTPDDGDLEATRLPGLRYPSDHMMIAAQFRLR